jgi:hypoxanthine phosphoribosyltransferase
VGEPIAEDRQQDREVLTWADFGVGIRQLARQVADSGYQPDVILAIARGGLIPAGALGYALSVKNTYVVNVEYYTAVDERLEVPVFLPPHLDLMGVEDQQFLVVDDVADTGHTLRIVKDFCGGKVAEVRSAVVYEKPQSVVRCEYVWRRTDRWINFPWSSEEPVTGPKAGVTVAPEL